MTYAHRPWHDSFEATDTAAGTQIFRKRRPSDDDDEDDRRIARDGDRVIVPALLMDSASRAGDAGDPPELHRPGYRGLGSAPQTSRSSPAAPPRAPAAFWCRDQAALAAHEERGRELADAWRDPGTHWGQAEGLLGPLTDEQMDRLVGAVEQPLRPSSSPRSTETRTEAGGRALLDQVLREREQRENSAWREVSP